jgi:hypothetical protein
LLTIQMLSALGRRWMRHAADAPLRLVQRNGRLT